MNERTRAWLRLSLGLLVTPVGLTLAIFLLRDARLPAALADALVFSGATGVALTALAITGTADVALGAAMSITLASAVTLGVIAYRRVSGSGSCVAVDAALVSLAWGLGSSLGWRVQHPSHLFPAAVVAASADVMSLLSPEGPSHAVARSERALSVLAIWFPVAGTNALAPALGVGDLLFVAFVLGAVRAHRLPYARAVGGCVAGVAVAGWAAAWLRTAIPALVTIAAATIACLPEIRRLRATERRAAHVSIALALSLALVTVARSALGSGR